MELVKVTITKSVGGKEFHNDWCFVNGDGPVVPTTEETIFGIIFGNPTIADYDVYDYTSGSYPANPTPLQALVAFEAGLRYNTVTVTKAVVSDGKKNTTLFMPVSINQVGLRTTASGGTPDIAPGNLIWDIVKQPLGASTRYGHFQCRLALEDEVITERGMDMIDWDSPVAKLLYDNLLVNVRDNSSLNHFLALEPGGDPNFTLAIPKMGNAASQNPGSWINATKIVELISGPPRGRQVHRGKKRSTP